MALSQDQQRQLNQAYETRDQMEGAVRVAEAQKNININRIGGEIPGRDGLVMAAFFCLTAEESAPIHDAVIAAFQARFDACKAQIAELEALA